MKLHYTHIRYNIYVYNKLRRRDNMDNLKDFFLDFRDDTLDFIDDHRKGLIITSFLAVLILIGLMIVLIMFTPEKIVISSADQELGNIIGTKARVLEF